MSLMTLSSPSPENTPQPNVKEKLRQAEENNSFYTGRLMNSV